MSEKNTWVIAFSDGRIFLGQVAAKGGYLDNAFEVFVARQMTPNGDLNMTVQITPLLGLAGSVKIYMPFDTLMIKLSDLDESDQNYIAGLLEAAARITQQIRAQRAGIEIASPIAGKIKVG